MSALGSEARRKQRARKRRQRDRKPKPAPTPTPVPAPASWELVFADEFDGESLDRSAWADAFPWGRDRSGVGELQYYGDDAFHVHGGLLSIEAREGSVGKWRYTSGLISTHQSFHTVYGRFEIRCRVPKGKGLWPAFWLLPVDTSWPPEIDVFEIIGQETDRVHMTYHERTPYDQHVSYGGEWAGPDFSVDFHTFALEWESDRLVWFVDGVERYRYEGLTPRVPMYLIANLAVGGNWPGAPDAQTRFPAAFEIDYIRTWKRA